MDKVPQIEVLESIMADGLALSLSTDLSEKRIGEVTIPPVELVSADVEGNGGGDWLTRETGSARRSRSLTTLGTRSGSVSRSLAMRRGNGEGLPMEHAEDVVHMRRRIVEGHDRIGVVGWCWWEWLSGNDGDLPTNEQVLICFPLRRNNTPSFPLRP